MIYEVKMKEARHKKILELIQQYDIETQEELASRLNDEGFRATQATVSRDIRELKIRKKQGGNAKAYAYSDQSESEHIPDAKYIRVLCDSVSSMEPAANILVIKTVSGMAMAAAAALDHCSLSEVAGCIAGDDTIMCVSRTPYDAQTVKQRIEQLMQI